MKYLSWTYSPIWFVLFVSLTLGLGYFTEVRWTSSEAQSTPKKTEPTPQPPTVMKLGDPLPANLFVELAKLVNPSVVSIATSVRPQRMYRNGNRDPFWQFFEEFMGPQQRQPETPAPAQPIGTGFIIEETGLIVTNNHVVEASDDLKVQLISHPDKFFDATIVGKDARTDVALIQIKFNGKLPFVKLGVSNDTQVGEWVAAFGNPYGHTFSMSKGIISAKSRKIRELNAIPFLQTDASINPGNSGGPLVNAKGEVIAVNSAIDARAQGIGFAIPIDHVKSIIPILKKEGHVIYGFIGVELAQITPRAQAALRLKNSDGALIADTMEGGPADKGGIQPSDVIREFDGKDIKAPEDLSDAVKETPVGKKVKVTVLREGKSIKLDVTVAEPPNERTIVRHGPRTAPLSGKSAPFQLGFKVADHTDKLSKEFRLPQGSPKGPIVVDIEADSIAAQNGLRVGDVILNVNRKSTRTVDEVMKSLVSGMNILRVRHGDRTSLVFIEAP